MDKQKSILLMAALMPSIVTAAPPFQLDVRAASKVTDNALRTESKPFSERQDSATVALRGGNENNWGKVNLNYANSWYWYEKDSQEERRTLTGRGDISLGNAASPVGLDLNHSSTYTLDKANQTDLLENQDKRQISQALPYLKYEVSAVDTLQVSGDFADIRYEDDTDKNSQREGGSVSWTHRFSRMDGITFSGSRNDIDFDQFSGAGYRYESATARFYSQLRKLSYSILAGANRYETDGKLSNSSPIYEVDVVYAVARHQLNLRLGQRYSDTSQGNANDVGFDGSSVGSSSKEIDIYERNFGRLSWAFTPIIDRLQATLFFDYEEEDYENLLQDSRSAAYGVSFTYALTQMDNFVWLLETDNNEFLQEINKDYDTERSRFSYTRSFTSGINLGAFWNYEKRKKNGDYNEQQLGINIGYSY